MRIFFFLFLMTFAVSCDPPYVEDYSNQPTKSSLATEVTNKTFRQLKAERELRPCGVGSGMMDQIKMLAMGFNYYKPIDIPQARELLMVSALRYLNNINSNEKIRQFLNNYPFRPDNIEIRIFLYQPGGSEVKDDSLSVISLINGVLNYKVNDSSTGLLKIYEETYEEAVEKLGVDKISQIANSSQLSSANL